jgi:signal transduction histidine kinase
VIGFVIGTKRHDFDQQPIDQSRQRETLIQNSNNLEMLAELGLAVSQIAHEIANPLDGIWACVQLLERDITREDTDPGRMRETLDSLNAQIGRLRNLLNELRELPRPLKLNLLPVALSPLVSETVDCAAPTVAPSILIRKDLPQNLPPVLADADKLKQVILNLVKNAVEAMPDGGTLTLRTYRTAKYVCFEIEDTGVGIPEGANLFHLFASSKPSGLGIGLCIVRQITAAHHGTIDYTSAVGKGTTFKVSLPSAGNVTRADFV